MSMIDIDFDASNHSTVSTETPPEENNEEIKPVMTNPKIKPGWRVNAKMEGVDGYGSYKNNKQSFSFSKLFCF